MFNIVNHNAVREADLAAQEELRRQLNRERWAQQPVVRQPHDFLCRCDRCERCRQAHPVGCDCRR